MQVVRGDRESLANVRERSTASRIVEWLAFILLLLCVALAPLPTGAVFPGGQFVIELFAFLAAGLAFAVRPTDVRMGAAAIPILSLVLLAAIGCFQLVPMSADGLRAASPLSARIYDESNAVLRLFGHTTVRPRISIAAADTEGTIVLILAYVALFSAAIILARTRLRRRILAAVLLFAATLHVAIAAIVGNRADRLHGAFVNPNHLAGYLQIALAFAFGVIWTEVLTGADRAEGLRDRAERLEKRAVPFVWRILLWGVLATGMALTRSRGGMLASAIATSVVLLIGILGPRISVRRPRAAASAVGAVVIGVLFALLIAGEAPMLRFLSSDPRDIGTDTRVEIWRASIDAWRLFPNFGSGLGTFREAFRRVQPSSVVGLVEQAHNDFLQLLVTGGWLGAVLGVVAFGSMIIALLTGWLQQRHREESAFVLAAFGALLALTIHGVFEFNMSIPAIPATLAVMLGAGWAAAQA
jgi:O-antigen ligase